jgi:hypothetical protein
MVAKNTTHPVTVAGVMEVDLTVYHAGIEICVDGATPVYVSTDPNNRTPSVNSDESEWIAANSSNIVVNRSSPPEQGMSGPISSGTKVWIYCAAAGVQLHVHGR